MNLGERLKARFQGPKYEYRVADSLKVALGSAWLHFWWWPLELLMKSPGREGSMKDWLGLAMVGAWFATGLVSLIALAFIPRDLTRPGRWWQVVAACILIGMVVYSAANWSP